MQIWVAARFRAPWYVGLLSINFNNEDLVGEGQQTGQYMGAFGRDGARITQHPGFRGRQKRRSAGAAGASHEVSRFGSRR